MVGRRTLLSGRELMHIANYQRSALVHAIAKKLVARLLICDDGFGRERWMFVTDGWNVPAAKADAARLGFIPLYVVNVWSKPNGR